MPRGSIKHYDLPMKKYRISWNDGDKPRVSLMEAVDDCALIERLNADPKIFVWWIENIEAIRDVPFTRGGINEPIRLGDRPGVARFLSTSKMRHSTGNH